MLMSGGAMPSIMRELRRRVRAEDSPRTALPAWPPAGLGWIREIKHDGFRILQYRNGHRFGCSPVKVKNPAARPSTRGRGGMEVSDDDLKIFVDVTRPATLNDGGADRFRHTGGCPRGVACAAVRDKNPSDAQGLWRPGLSCLRDRAISLSAEAGCCRMKKPSEPATRRPPRPRRKLPPVCPYRLARARLE